MKNNNSIGAYLTLFVMSIIITCGAFTASAAQIHKFGRPKMEAKCTLSQEEERDGYRILLGSQTFYEGAGCWNGTSNGAAIRAIIERDTKYICKPVVINGKRGYEPVYKWLCGNQIDVIEKVEIPVEEPQRPAQYEQPVQYQQTQQSNGWQQCFTQASSLYTGLCNVAQQYGYSSQQYQQSCTYVCQQAPQIAPQIITRVTKNNYSYVDNSVHDSFNNTDNSVRIKTINNPPSTPAPYCPPVTNQQGTGVLTATHNSRSPVADNGTTVNPGSSVAPGNPNGITGRNGSAVTLASAQAAQDSAPTMQASATTTGNLGRGNQRDMAAAQPATATLDSSTSAATPTTTSTGGGRNQRRLAVAAQPATASTLDASAPAATVTPTSTQPTNPGKGHNRLAAQATQSAAITSDASVPAPTATSTVTPTGSGKGHNRLAATAAQPAVATTQNASTPVQTTAASTPTQPISGKGQHRLASLQGGATASPAASGPTIAQAGTPIGSTSGHLASSPTTSPTRLPSMAPAQHSFAPISSGPGSVSRPARLPSISSSPSMVSAGPSRLPSPAPAQHAFAPNAGPTRLPAAGPTFASHAVSQPRPSLAPVAPPQTRAPAPFLGNMAGPAMSGGGRNVGGGKKSH